jgi:AcrR family transcriptional regulator
MSEIAERAGIGRATLYRYFPDVDAILLAWHERQISKHPAQLAEVRDRAGNATDRLEAVLQAYAFMAHEHEDSDLAASLHRAEHVANADQHLHDFIRDLLIEGAQSGALRDDIAPGELASYCLHALTAARTLPSKAAVKRLVTVTLDGLRTPPSKQPPHRERDLLRHRGRPLGGWCCLERGEPSRWSDHSRGPLSAASAVSLDPSRHQSVSAGG